MDKQNKKGTSTVSDSQFFSILKKILYGIFVITVIGVASYILLFILMLSV